MKQFAIIGLSSFGIRLLEEFLQIDVEVLVVDKDREVIEQYKDRVSAAYIADVIKEETIKKIVPADIDAAIVDLGEKHEVSILVVNYLKKLGIKTIIAKAETNEHGEILELIGATRVVYPDREAANRIAPVLASSALFNFLPISKGLVIAEVRTPKHFVGKSLIEADIRRKFKLNVIALTQEKDMDYEFVSPEHRLKDDDLLLLVGKEEDIALFSGAAISGVSKRKKSLNGIFKRLFIR
jgi:trk system potassium uptake protein